MYLKSIDVIGFKSFANKITFEFKPGITAIVGPNGSGKSNVADAVRWVLGEQSAKQLRGSSMTDVIFSGTEHRSPQGYAQVAITLDNQDHSLPVDYEEVTVTRRVYRSGESEYLMNGSSCRLRDIQELFFDTGIGQEGYSIIGQGQIEKILSPRSEERRELFDEAVGIVKYKKRKRIALKKLENERANLERVTDILGELTRQVGPLERQAKNAKIYLEKRDLLKDAEVRLFVEETSKIAADLKQDEQALSVVRDNLAQVGGEYEEVKQLYQGVEEEQQQLEQALEAARAVQTEHLEAYTGVQNEVAVLQVEERNLTEKRSSMSAVQDELRQRQERLNSEVEAAAQAQRVGGEIITLLETECVQLQQNLTDIQKLLAADDQDLAQQNRSALSVLANRGDLQGSLSSMKTELAAMEERRQQLEEQISALVDELADAQEEEEALLTKAGRLQADESAGQEEKQRIRQSIEEKDAEVKEAQQKLEQLRAQYHQQRSRLETLTDMEAGYEGYSFSIQKVMERAKQVPGVVGVVADLIRVEQRYETAIEIALGARLHQIVTEDDRVAKDMIRFLKEKRFGRATFIPLSNISKKQPTDGAGYRKTAGFICMANQAVDCDVQYRHLIDDMLGNTLLFDDIEHATAAARAYGHRLRIVTLEGDLLNPGGSLTGGSIKQSQHLLGRKREIEALQKQTEELRRAAVALETAIFNGKNKRRSLWAQMEGLDQQFTDLNLQGETNRVKLEQTQSNIRRCREQLDIIRAESEQLSKTVAEKQAAFSFAEQSWQASVQKEQEISDAAKDLADLASLHRQQEESLRSLIGQKQQDLALEKQKKEAGQSEQLRLQEELKRIAEQLTETAAALEQIEEKQIEIHGGLTEKEGRITALLTVKEEDEQAVSRLKEEKDRLYRDNKEFLSRREALIEQKSLLEKDEYRLEDRVMRKQNFLEERESHIWDEYQLTPREARSKHSLLQQAEDFTEMALPEQKRAIAEIKKDIKALGSINVNAIEEYQEVSQRYEFLRAQHSDLLEAEKALLGVVAELDQGMKQQFREQFALIQAEFQQVFAQLFGGGKGSIEMIDEANVLETDIAIIAQPPGKKLQNMMQLSGGEKALTAISLLFAIQNLKPSPFCLLDEIEAALDDSNVVRYAQYLHKLTDHTQFITITHRRGTMTAADRLYGITMQEKGVSTLVSVNLIEDSLED